MKRLSTMIALLVALAGVPTAAQADHNEDEHSKNMRLLANWDDGGEYRQGSDLAFWKNTAVLGNYGQPGGFRLLDISKPRKPELIGQFQCPGSQADVSIFRKLVFVSVDATMAGPECGEGGASMGQVLAGDHWEGLRIVSIENPKNPVQIAAVDTDCGSHTHTLVPDLKNKRLLAYILSYPLGGQGAECNVFTHRKISVVEIPLANPAKAEVIGTPSVSPAIGCHDVTIFREKNLAGAACISESQIWDISDPANPEVISHIYNPAVNIHHTTTFSNDGETLAIGDELGGAAFSPGCFTEGHAPIGAIWFYDVSDPASPSQEGWFQVPQAEHTNLCTAHNFNVVPMRKNKDILVTGWYNAGTAVIDFTDPSSPRQIAHYTPKEGALANSWSSYWYNGFIYVNNFDESFIPGSDTSRGFDVLKLRHPAVRKTIRVHHLNPQVQDPL